MQDIMIPIDDPRLELKGDVPNRDVTITKECNIAFAIHNDRYCAIKDYNTSDILIRENSDNCILPKDYLK